MKSKTYDKLKFLAQVLLPGVGTLYFSLSGVWGEHIFPAADQVSGTILALDTFLGIFLADATRRYRKSDDRFDGHISVKDNEDEGTSEVGVSINPDSLTTKDEVTLKVKDMGRVLEGL